MKNKGHDKYLILRDLHLVIGFANTIDEAKVIIMDYVKENNETMVQTKRRIIYTKNNDDSDDCYSNYQILRIISYLA